MQNMSGGKTALGLDANVGAGLCYVLNLVCYLGVVYSIIVLVTDKENKLTRFHAVQSLLLLGLGIVLTIVLYIGMFIGVFIDTAIGLPVVSGISGLLMLIVGLAMLVFVILAAVKAFQGQIYKIPVIGGFADKFSS
ncbi:MAG: DUF4870 domain-containing protein [Acidobacteria bacterium]|nr:DUF4870 domain-containing protein [Acidobacteriota bacterium]